MIVLALFALAMLLTLYALSKGTRCAVSRQVPGRPAELRLLAPSPVRAGAAQLADSWHHSVCADVLLQHTRLLGWLL